MHNMHGKGALLREAEEKQRGETGKNKNGGREIRFIKIPPCENRKAATTGGG